VNRTYVQTYEDVTGHPYVSTFYTENKELPQWIREMDNEQLFALNKRLSKSLMADGARLLLDPECIRKV
jgi:hypothetical protein